MDNSLTTPDDSMEETAHETADANDVSCVVECFRRALEQNDAAAQYRLGECYAEGHGVEQDVGQAMLWFRKAAAQGYAPAQYRLGECYAEGHGVERDVEQAMLWYRKAAAQASSQPVPDMCNEECPETEEELEQSIAYTNLLAMFSEDSEEENIPEANATEGYDNEEKRDYTQTVECFRMAALQGHAEAQNNLGMCYYQGHGVEWDFRQAVAWFLEAARQGHADAQNNLGLCYYLGHGVKQDYKQAVAWFLKAAKQGHAGAQHNLGVCYDKGHGVRQDTKKADEYFLQSAAKNFDWAPRTASPSHPHSPRLRERIIFRSPFSFWKG